MEERVKERGEGPDREGRTLRALVAALEGATPSAAGLGAAGDRAVTAITTRSDDVEEGAVFVAIRGTETDGHAFVAEAVERGAAAVVVEPGYEGDVPVPLVRVPDTRRAAAELAAAWYGHPARRLRLVGITGSIGKTSILAMLEAILEEAGVQAGAVGSLGVHVDGEVRTDTGHTAPGPLLLHRELARIADEGCELAAMEVTSHALVQERVHGLSFDLGIFTNLVPLEHSEYHPTFLDYANAKRRFFDHLQPCAPLVFSSDSLVVRRLVHEADAEPVGCGTARSAMVRIRDRETGPDGSRFTLDVRRPIPGVDGGEVDPVAVPLELRLLGDSNIGNAALAATTALSLGLPPAPIRRALGRLPRQPRRLEVVHRGRFLLLDDTVGHPDSVSALFQVVEALRPRRVHIAYAVRGMRGARVNRHTAETLAVWAERAPLGRLVVTRSAEAADERNRVEPPELEAVESALRGRVACTVKDRLDAAVHEVLEAAGEDDLVLLLGAQGMDAGADVARAWLKERGDG